MLKAIRIAELVVILLFLALPYSGFAQAAGASLTGQVTDQAGAAIPNAAVSVENTGTIWPLIRNLALLVVTGFLWLSRDRQ